MSSGKIGDVLSFVFDEIRQVFVPVINGFLECSVPCGLPPECVFFISAVASAPRF